MMMPCSRAISAATSTPVNCGHTTMAFASMEMSCSIWLDISSAVEEVSIT